VLRGLNLDHAVYQGHTSQVITCVYLPPMMSVARLAKRLKEQGIVIYNGKGPLKDRLFQLGHIGALRHEDTLFALEQLTRIIKDSRGIEQHLPLGIEPLGDEVHDAA
jgi:aspartate aminotransferase-like enzyme